MNELMEGYKGTKDFLPKEWRLIDYILKKWKIVSESYGFEEYEAPILEPLKLFTDKSGEEIKEQLFWFKDKGDRELALRPELTPQLARYVVQYGGELKKPLKWFSMPRLFRYEQPQRGRGREFFQYNADIVGSGTPESTAEIINLAISILKSFGLKSTDIKIRINDRQIVNQLIDKFKIKKEKEFYALLDKRYKLKNEVFLEELRKIVKSKELEELLKRKGTVCLKELSKIVDTTRAEKVLSLVEKGFAEFDLSIVRGLAYYTGIVFEAYDAKGELRAGLGGGEYNNLVSDFGGPQIPCVGFGLGDMVLAELLKDRKLIPEFRKEGIYIATIGNVFKEASELANKLRIKQPVFLNTADQGISKQLTYAGDAGYEKVIIVGERDLKEGKVTVKNMKTGKEEKKDISKV